MSLIYGIVGRLAVWGSLAALAIYGSSALYLFVALYGDRAGWW